MTVLNGCNWQRIKDFHPDPNVKFYLVLPVGRLLDIARFKNGKFYEYEHDDWELDVNYWIPIPDTPQEMTNWFYGQPNGYQLRTQPPWISEEEWNQTLQRERESRGRLEGAAPVGSHIRFQARHYDNKKRDGIIESVETYGYMARVGEKELWYVEENQILSVVKP